MKTLRSILLLLFFLTWAAPVYAAMPAQLKSLSELSREKKEAQDEKRAEQEAKKLRHDAIRQAGITVAIQSAVKYRYDEINQKLYKIAPSLEKLDFALLLIHDGRVMPPIFREAKQSLQIEENGTLERSSQHVYQILRHARIVTTTPTWRQYLIRKFKAIDDVDHLLLPQDEEEQEIWKASVAKGWKIGIKQAENEFNVNWNRLVRDFIGIIIYHRLALQGVVSVPKVAEGKYGIVIRDDIMDIDQRTIRIIAPTKFNKEEKWRPIIYSKTNL